MGLSRTAIRAATVVGVSAVVVTALVSAAPETGAAGATHTVVKTWGPLAGADDLGRVLPDSAAVGTPKSNKAVGVIFEPWHGQNGPRDYKNSFSADAILAANPKAPTDTAGPEWPDAGHFAYWGKPLFGDYRSDDPWVVRRQLEMLADAGVDFIELDASNNLIFKPEAELIMRTIEDMQREGRAAPQVTFMTRGNSTAVMDEIYRTFYAPDSPYRHPTTWFRWKGKPLIVGVAPSATVRSFFTFRYAQWPNEAAQKCDGWDWESFDRPARLNHSCAGEKEEIGVSVAQNSGDPPIFSFTDYYGVGDSHSRNYHNGAEDNSAGAVNRGYNFQEEWDGAIAQDPEVITVEGFNEWDAGNWQDEARTGPITFYDLSSERYSRDTEPMSGGYGDDYYLQLISNIRRFKGTVAAVTPSGPASIDPAGGFGQWSSVSPAYQAYSTGPTDRDHEGVDNQTYVNTTSRNVFRDLKVARDKNDVYFYANTVKPITSRNGNWMTLFLNTDGDETDGWNGFDFVVNRDPTGNGTTTLERSLGGWQWQKVSAAIRYRVAGSQLMLAVPRSLLGLANDPLHVEFKWADNWRTDGDIMDFYQYGDAAPYGRLSYVFDTGNATSAAAAAAPPTPGADPRPASHRIENTDRLTEYNDYSGSNANWKQVADPAASGGSYAALPGGDQTTDPYWISTVTSAFTGSSIRWIARRAPDGDPQVEVFIDGVSQGMVSLAGSSTADQATVFAKYGLPPGPHEITIKCANMAGTTCYHDAFEYQDSAPAAVTGNLAASAYAAASGYTPARWYAAGPAQAVDNNAATAWHASGASNQWLTVDFGRSRVFDAALISGGSTIRNYAIQYWTGREWRTVFNGTTPAGPNTFAPVHAQKVRLYIRQASSPPRVAEFGLFHGTTTPPPAMQPVSPGKPASASSTEAGHDAGLAVDGRADTYWSAANSTLPQWITVDLGHPVVLSAITTEFTGSDTWQYWVEASTDNSRWIHLVTSDTGGREFTDTVAGSYRYVRVQVRGAGQPAAIGEITVYGS